MCGGPHFRVRNWSEYQHYKDRNPPWVKLHFALLSSRDWVLFDDASRVLAVACMLIASRDDGRVPADAEYLQRVAYLNSVPNLKPLVDSGFLEDASGLLADASTLQADARPEERQRRDRGETEESKKRARPRFKPPTVDDVRAYCTERGNTIDPQRFVDHYTANGWVRGKTPIKDWQAAVRTWERNEIGKPAKAPAVGTSDPNEFKPWHAEDVRKHGGKNLHPQWNAYFDAMDAKYEPGEKWDRFDDWMKRNA